MRIASIALLGLVFCICAGRSPAQQRPASAKSTASDLTASRKKLFESNCAGCHGLDARGGEHAPNIANNPDVKRMSDDQLFRIVHDGAASGAMPAFGSILSEPRIKQVVAYLRTLQGLNDGIHVKFSGDPTMGKSLFFGKAACSQCHSVVDSGAGAGGFIAADLTSYAAGREPSEILRAIASPNENPGPRSRTALVTMIGGAKLTGVIRNQDNFSMQLQSLNGAFHLLERSAIATVSYDSQSLMPADYSQRLTPAELDDLVAFLIRAAADDAATGRHDQNGHNDEAR